MPSEKWTVHPLTEFQLQTLHPEHGAALRGKFEFSNLGYCLFTAAGKDTTTKMYGRMVLAGNWIRFELQSAAGGAGSVFVGRFVDPKAKEREEAERFSRDVMV